MPASPAEVGRDQTASKLYGFEADDLADVIVILRADRSTRRGALPAESLAQTAESTSAREFLHGVDV